MSYCSPKSNSNKDTCFNDTLLEQIVKEYNRQYPENNIDESLSNSEKIELIRKSLKNETGCDDEWCLSNSTSLSKYRKQINDSFRPPVPKNWNVQKRTWLNTLDIFAILSQYEEAYPEFNFISVSPIDFDTLISRKYGYKKDCVDEELCSLDLNDEAKTKITKLGAVFNLDKHDQGGSHWVCFFTNLILGEAYYYDSVANKIPIEVVNFMERLSMQYDSLLLSNLINVNTVNRFNFILSKDMIFNKNSFIFPLEIFCNWLTMYDHFMLYRFASFRKSSDCLWRSKKIKIEKNEKLIERVLSQVINVIDLTHKERYANIDDIDKLLSNLNNGHIDINEFTENWVNSHITKCMNKYLKSLRIFMVNNNKYKVKSINLVDNNIIVELSGIDLNENDKLIDISYKLFKNYVQHQFKNTECGMYCIHFLDRMLVSNHSFHHIIMDGINDDNMNELRYSKYYRPNN